MMMSKHERLFWATDIHIDTDSKLSVSGDNTEKMLHSIRGHYGILIIRNTCWWIVLSHSSRSLNKKAWENAVLLTEN